MPRLLLALALAAAPAGPAAQDEFLDAQILSEFDRYIRQARRLRGFRDAGSLDEEAMLGLLRAEGVFEALPSAAGGGRRDFADGFRPFKVRVYAGLWRWPLRSGVVSSEFGRRRGRRHEGLDIAADAGVPVLASAAGTVLYSGSGIRGYGNAVILRHDQDTTTLYAHNQRLLVRKGQRVQAGQWIALLGSTGRSTGPHVHFEMRKKGKALDPRRLLIRSRF